MAEHFIWDELNRDPDRERAEQDRFVAARADIWRAARSVLLNSGELNPAAEDVTDLARFLAGDGAG